MRAREFIIEGSNTSLENAINKMADGYLNGTSPIKDTCYAHVGKELARLKPDDATIRFWGRKPKLIVHGDAVLPDGTVISTISTDQYDKIKYEIVSTMSLAELLRNLPDKGMRENVEIPIGRGRAITTAPDILYHSLRGRSLNASGGIDAYLPGNKQEWHELKTRFRRPIRGIVYLSNRPLDKSALMIDAYRLDPNLLRYTGQSEGYLIYGDNIPADAIIDISDEEAKTTIDEMALPPDWDPAALGHDKSFKSRLEYVLSRVRRLGTGTSRVAFIIPDNGRDTVLKIAKNKKGLAQNEAEVAVLTDDYVRSMDLVIPLIDYDKLNPVPTWLQTELARKVNRRQLEEMLFCSETPWGLEYFVDAVYNITGRRQSHMPTLEEIKEELEDSDYNEEEIEIFMEYANEVAMLITSSTLLLDDLRNVNNWGEYNGRPVIIDLGYTEAVEPLYYKDRQNEN